MVRSFQFGIFVAALVGGIQNASADCTLTTTNTVPLIDQGVSLYKGFDGGLYGSGSNVMPASHRAAALDIARNGIKPIDGKVVMISLGMSNTTMEFSEFVATLGTFADLNTNLVVVDGAQGASPSEAWDEASDPTYDVVDDRLTAASVSPDQVQVAWIKQAIPQPATEGAFPLHAIALQLDLEEIARALKVRYPNIKLAYYSSRTRAWAYDGDKPSHPLNPEPFAFESGFSARWAIEKQMSGDALLNFDASRGAVTAPLMLWGPYLWADGSNARSDGFVWNCSDTLSDFTHPSRSGEQKVAAQLLNFFSTDETAVPWFTESWEPGDDEAPTPEPTPGPGGDLPTDDKDEALDGGGSSGCSCAIAAEGGSRTRASAFLALFGFVYMRRMRHRHA